jgi:serine/threonine protein kinase
MSLSKGDRLGPYECLAPIGAGGMGEVFKAKDTRLDRIVALKIAKAAFSERFEREARAISSLNHPHICQLYDVGPNYLVMEYIEGVPLKGPLPLDKVLEYAGQIASALDAAHAKKITHRDLKPANILVTKSAGPAQNSNAYYDVAPDGRFLMTTFASETTTGPVTLLLNWKAALKK